MTILAKKEFLLEHICINKYSSRNLSEHINFCSIFKTLQNSSINCHDIQQIYQMCSFFPSSFSIISYTFWNNLAHIFYNILSGRKNLIRFCSESLPFIKCFFQVQSHMIFLSEAQLCILLWLFLYWCQTWAVHPFLISLCAIVHATTDAHLKYYCKSRFTDPEFCLYSSIFKI